MEGSNFSLSIFVYFKLITLVLKSICINLFEEDTKHFAFLRKQGKGKEISLKWNCT